MPSLKDKKGTIYDTFGATGQAPILDAVFESVDALISDVGGAKPFNVVTQGRRLGPANLVHDWTGIPKPHHFIDNGVEQGFDMVRNMITGAVQPRTAAIARSAEKYATFGAPTLNPASIISDITGFFRAPSKKI